MIVFGWILFRSTDLGLFGTYISRLFVAGAPTLVTVPVVLALIVVIGMQLLPPRPVERLQIWIEGLNPIGLAAGVAVTILIVGATVPSQGVPPFIYFQF